MNNPSIPPRGTNSDLVPYYDLTTKTTVLIPKLELSPGSVLVQVEGMTELVYADASKILDGEIRHEQLKPELVALIRQLASDLADVRPLSITEWEDGFKKDTHPEREVEIWRHIADTLKVMTGHFKFKPHKKQECFNLILRCSTGPRSSVKNRFDKNLLTSAQVERIIKHYYENQPF